MNQIELERGLIAMNFFELKSIQMYTWYLQVIRAQFIITYLKLDVIISLFIVQSFKCITTHISLMMT